MSALILFKFLFYPLRDAALQWLAFRTGWHDTEILVTGVRAVGTAVTQQAVRHSLSAIPTRHGRRK